MALPKGVFRGLGLYRAETTSSMEAITIDDGSGLQQGYHCFVDNSGLFLCTDADTNGSTWVSVDIFTTSSKNTLDEAYDEGGPGSGRQITVDSGAVQFQGTLGANSLEITGTVDIFGHLAASTKSFVIKHPSDKKGLLRHGSLEGPEHAVFIRGKNIGNKITLPDYWKDLVDESTITINLQPINYFQKLVVKSWDSKEIIVKDKNLLNLFRNEYFFYTVYAERKDVKRLIVEDE
jgi:hypothetical protein